MRERFSILALFMPLMLALGCHNSEARQREKQEPKPGAKSEKAEPAVVELRHVMVSAKQPAKPETPPIATVDQEAPDFELPAYHDGKFTTVKLSDHRGKWVLLCFYPGDFTFV